MMRLALAWILVLSACAGSTKDPMKDLKDAVDGYNTAFRWKNFGKAAAYLPNDLRAEFVAYFDEDSASLHIEAVEVLRVDAQSDDAAEVTVRYRYMLLPSVTVQKKVVVQSWHQVDEHWILENEEPLLIDYRVKVDAPEAADEDDDGWTDADEWTAD